MEKIGWTDCVRNEELLHRVKEGRNILRTIKSNKANCIGYILHRIGLLKPIVEEKIRATEVKERRVKRRKQLVDDFKRNERILEIERGSTRSHSVENSFAKRLWITE